MAVKCLTMQEIAEDGRNDSRTKYVTEPAAAAELKDINNVNPSIEKKTNLTASPHV